MYEIHLLCLFEFQEYEYLLKEFSRMMFNFHVNKRRKHTIFGGSKRRMMLNELCS